MGLASLLKRWVLLLPPHAQLVDHVPQNAFVPPNGSTYFAFTLANQSADVTFVVDNDFNGVEVWIWVQVRQRQGTRAKRKRGLDLGACEVDAGGKGEEEGVAMVFPLTYSPLA